MSETEGFSALPAESQKQKFELPQSSQESMTVADRKIGMGSLDEKLYHLGEVPQSHLSDPQAFLPLDSDRLNALSNTVETLLTEAGLLIQEEVSQIQRLQKRINTWEDRIEKNKAIVARHEAQIKQNRSDIGYDKKNRDYWMGRAEQVMLDYQDAAASDRKDDWSWLIKKYGLKNAEGEVLDVKNPCVDELCNGEVDNLAAEYRAAGNKYEQARKDKEAENSRLIRENGVLLNTNDTLQGYISATYSNEIEPLQDGVLLLKELGVKVKAFSQSDRTSYGDLRSWAEPFLSDFLKSNPRVLLHIVTHFRRLTSIPLPPTNA